MQLRTLKRLSARRPYTKFTKALRSFLIKHGLNVIPAIICGLVQTDVGAEIRGIVMMRTIPKVALLIGALAVAGQASAHGGWGAGPAIFGAVVGAAVVGSVIAGQEQRPVYVQQPVYVQPQPVYVQAPLVYYQPQPVYVQPPQPVYYEGYYGRPHPAYYGPPRGYYGPPRW